MEKLIEISRYLIQAVSLTFRRYLFDQIDWDARLIAIKGARGTGKTTMLLQWLAEQNQPPWQAVYFSMDELYFVSHTLVDTAATFRQHGGKVMVLDEVHKYKDWAREIKIIYDRYADLKVIFTGSSIIDITRQEGDLSRRALFYELKGLSYREYLSLHHGISFPSYSLSQLLDRQHQWSTDFPSVFRPLALFKDYLQYGYYPFSVEGYSSYYQRLRQMVRLIVEYDMAEVKGFDIRHAQKLLQLLHVVAQQVPFSPNIKSLAEKTRIHRNSINNYLYFLHEARLIHLLYPKGYSVAVLQKPEKIYLENTNLLYALSDEEPSVGTVRVVFFNNQISIDHVAFQSQYADFEIDGRHFEVGGRHKNKKQLKGAQQGWVVKDDIEYPVGHSLPLWIFGFLY